MYPGNYIPARSVHELMYVSCDMLPSNKMVSYFADRELFA